MPTAENLKFCIIIPSYNRLQFLSEAITSCLRCDLPNGVELKIVIIDDGSRDETTPEIISRFQMSQRPDEFYEGANIFIKKIANSERGYARNRGAEFAIHTLKADWLLFMDADDVLQNDALLKMFAHVNPSVSMVSARYRLWDGHKLIGGPMPAGRSKVLRAEAFLNDNPMFIGATILRPEVFLKAGGFSENREVSGSEDWLFLFKAVSSTEAIIVDCVFLWYRRHENNTPPERTEAAIKEMHVELIDFLKTYYRESFADTYQRILFFHKLLIIGAYNSNQYHTIALRKSWTLFKENPFKFLNRRALRVAASVLTRRFVS